MGRSVCRASVPKYTCSMNSGIRTTNRKARAQTALGETSQLEALCVFTWARGALSLTQLWKQFTRCLPVLLPFPLNSHFWLPRTLLTVRQAWAVFAPIWSLGNVALQCDHPWHAGPGMQQAKEWTQYQSSELSRLVNTNCRGPHPMGWGPLLGKKEMS